MNTQCTLNNSAVYTYLGDVYLYTRMYGMHNVYVHLTWQDMNRLCSQDEQAPATSVTHQPAEASLPIEEPAQPLENPATQLV